MHIESIEYSFDGIRLVGELAVDDAKAGKRPAVLVSHEGGGMTDHARTSARRLAELGYVAFALDYLGGGQPPPPDELAARFTALRTDPLRARQIGMAGLNILLGSDFVDPSRVAAIGYCFGGTLSLELARAGTDLCAVVGFHAGLSTNTPAAPGVLTAKVLACIGAEDPYVPVEQRVAFEEEMRGAEVADWRLNLYGGAQHSFTNPTADGTMPGVVYNASADKRSWNAMLELFSEVF